jgi:hypothetical protein
MQEDYRFDWAAKLSPTDLALGWGRMSDPKVSCAQAPTCTSFRRGPRSAPHSPSQVVSLEGELIEASHPSGWTWRSSLAREDAGAGVCEVVLVSRLSIE